jgi:prepilin-type N-terminal cleavage/methylation domain-containing protein
MQTRGFSLIELLIAISIILIVGAAITTSYTAARGTGEPLHDSYMYVDALREATLRARSMEYDTDWGVKITGGNTIVFSGSSYASRTASRDHAYDSSDTLTVGGVTEIVFAKFSGTPNTSGTTTFQNKYATTSVNVSATGVISY